MNGRLLLCLIFCSISSWGYNQTVLEGENLLKTGQQYLEDARFEEAEATLHKVLKIVQTPDLPANARPLHIQTLLSLTDYAIQAYFPDQADQYLVEAQELCRSNSDCFPSISAQIRYLEGRRSYQQGDVEKALIKLEEALGLLDPSILDETELLIRINLSLGGHYIELGKKDKGLAIYEEIQDLLHKNQELNAKYQAKLLIKQASYLSEKGAFQDADSMFLLANSLLKENYPIHHPAQVNWHIERGVYFIERNKAQQALPLFKDALKINKELYTHDHPAFGKNYFHLGSWAYRAGQLEESLSYYNQALELRKKVLPPTHPTIPATLSAIGRCYTLLQDFDQALVYYSRCEDLLRQTYGDGHIKLTTVLNNKAISFYRKGSFKEAAQFMEQVLDIEKKYYSLEDRKVAQTLHNLGMVYSNLHEFEKAETNLNLALKIKRTIFNQDNYSVAMTLQNLANLYYEKGDFLLSLEYLDIVYPIKVASLGEFHPAIAMVHLFCAENYLNLKNYQAVIQASDKAIKSVLPDFVRHSPGQIPDYKDQVFDYQYLLTALEFQARSYQLLKANSELENKKIADSLYQHCVELIEVSRNSFRHTGSKLFLSENISYVFDLALDNAKDLYLQTNDPIYLEHAFYYSEKGRSALLNQAIQAAGKKFTAGVPLELLDRETQLNEELAAQEKQIYVLEKSEKEKDKEELIEVRASLLGLKRSYDSLQQVIQTEYGGYYELIHSEDIATIQAVQSTLKTPNELVIEYFWGDTTNTLHAFAISKDKSICLQLAHLDTLAPQIERFVDNLMNWQLYTNESSSIDYLGDLKQDGFSFYQSLIAPILEQLKEPTNNLTIIPSGLLNYLPFELLLTDFPASKNIKTWPYLLRQYPITYEYSATLLHTRLPAKNASEIYAGFAPSYGDSTQNSTIRSRRIISVDPNSFLALKYNQEEVERIQSLLGGRTFLKEEATEKAFIKNANAYQILHLAMHAYTDDENPLYSGFAFQPSQDSIEDDFLHIYELYNLELQAELAILSACNTGTGKLAKGEGIISLARAFKYSGCPAVVTSLWQANDASTMVLIERFVQYTKAGLPKHKALQQAKLDYLDQANQFQAHPFHWAPFVLIGDNAPLRIQEPALNYRMLILALLLVFGVALFLFSRKNNQLIS